MYHHPSLQADPNGFAPAGARAFRAQVMSQTVDLAIELIRKAIKRHRQRVAANELRALNDQALKDIGMHRSGVLAAVRTSDFDHEDPRNARH